MNAKEFRESLKFPKSSKGDVNGMITTDDLMEMYAETYHQAKLKLLGIADVVGRSEQLCPDCKVELKPLYDEMACFKCMKHYPKRA